MADTKRSPLEIAIANRDGDGVRAAIADGADLNAPFADGLTPLCRAAALGEKRGRQRGQRNRRNSEPIDVHFGKNEMQKHR